MNRSASAFADADQLQLLLEVAPGMDRAVGVKYRGRSPGGRRSSAWSPPLLNDALSLLTTYPRFPQHLSVRTPLTTSPAHSRATGCEKSFCDLLLAETVRGWTRYCPSLKRPLGSRLGAAPVLRE